MSGWVLNGATPQSRIRRQQGGGNVMIWAGIMNDAIVSPFAVPHGVKMNAQSYVEFLKKKFLSRYENQENDTYARQCPISRSSLHLRRPKQVWHLGWSCYTVASMFAGS